MKKLFFGCIVLCLLFIACGYESACLECKNPFIVGEIRQLKDETLSMYTTKGYNITPKGIWYGKATIIAATGFYNIGDTIKICR